MIYLLYTIHVLISIFLIVVVLLQRGKGADLSVFGGGATQAAFGARGSASLLHKMTVGFFVLFILTTLGIAWFQGGSSSRTVLSGEPVATDATPAADEALGVETAGDEGTSDEGTPDESATDANPDAPALEAGAADTPPEETPEGGNG